MFFFPPFSSWTGASRIEWFSSDCDPRGGRAGRPPKAWGIQACGRRLGVGGLYGSGLVDTHVRHCAEGRAIAPKWGIHPWSRLEGKPSGEAWVTQSLTYLWCWGKSILRASKSRSFPSREHDFRVALGMFTAMDGHSFQRWPLVGV